MNPRRLVNWLIVLTVAAGMLSLPFVTPVIAMTHHGAASGAFHAMDDVHAVADGMPCCPDDGTPARDCDSCPLMALCSLTIPIPAPAAASVLAPDLIAQAAFVLPDDLLIGGVGARPPDHPPRTLI